MALISSKLDYCNSLFQHGNISLYGISDGLFDKLQKVQNAAARLVVKSLRSDHITFRLCVIHWLPLRSRIKYEILVATYRALHNEALAYISEMLTPSTPPRTLRSTNTSLLTVLTAHTKQRDRTFSWAAPRLWNKLPIYIKNPLLPKKVVLEGTESLPGLVLSEYLMASPTVNSAYHKKSPLKQQWLILKQLCGRPWQKWLRIFWSKAVSSTGPRRYGGKASQLVCQLPTRVVKSHEDL